MSLSNSAELPEGTRDPVFFLSSDKHKMASPTPVSLHKPVKHPLPLALCTGTPAPGRTARTAFLLICQRSVHAAYLCCINHSFIACPPPPSLGAMLFFFQVGVGNVLLACTVAAL